MVAGGGGLKRPSNNSQARAGVLHQLNSVSALSLSLENG